MDCIHRGRHTSLCLPIWIQTRNKQVTGSWSFNKIVYTAKASLCCNRFLLLKLCIPCKALNVGCCVIQHSPLVRLQAAKILDSDGNLTNFLYLQRSWCWGVLPGGCYPKVCHGWVFPRGHQQLYSGSVDRTGHWCSDVRPATGYKVRCCRSSHGNLQRGPWLHSIRCSVTVTFSHSNCQT